MVTKSKPHIKKIILNEILIHPLLVNFIPQKKSLRTNGSVDKMSVLKMLQTEVFLCCLLFQYCFFLPNYLFRLVKSLRCTCGVRALVSVFDTNMFAAACDFHSLFYK